jgi:hypothetical protein
MENVHPPALGPHEATVLLRADRRLPAVLQFCRLFPMLKIKQFSAELLERALIHPEDEQHQGFLAELVFKLLRRDSHANYTDKALEGWDLMLAKKMDRQWHEAFECNPLGARDFMEVNALTKVCWLTSWVGRSLLCDEPFKDEHV